MRKSSSHKTLTVHFHDNGDVCPASFGQSCPHGPIGNQQTEPLSPSFFAKLPNGFKFPPQLNGLASMFSNMGGVKQGPDFGLSSEFSMFEDNDMSSLLLSSGMGDLSDFTSLSNNTSYFGGSGGGGGSHDLNAFSVNNLNSSDDLLGTTMLQLAPKNETQTNESIAQMAHVAVTSGNPQAVAAMAQMAAASGNPMAAAAMVQLVKLAAENGMTTIPPTAVMQIMAKTGLGGRTGLNAAMTAAKSVSQAQEAQVTRYQALMSKEKANVQINTTLANSSLAKLGDEEVIAMSDGKFATAKEFISYMQSPETEVRK
jgi:hypothetical protein